MQATRDFSHYVRHLESGLSHIDLAAAKKYGITVSRCPEDGDEVVKTGTAEQTWNLILALMRDLHARLGSTVVIVTHDMTVADLARSAPAASLVILARRRCRRR